ncbi:unnamed protein product [Pseudo-nitzschia multistriata]|uniref:L domain-like protein n=1 Tax=Pseudo-nitzschia multistriata TaxID=183589 RepID=A0A448ZRJ3_9STRA|nr:unnamed protein product [Pseudo-nitzschia multistriata]
MEKKGDPIGIPDDEKKVVEKERDTAADLDKEKEDTESVSSTKPVNEPVIEDKTHKSIQSTNSGNATNQPGAFAVNNPLFRSDNERSSTDSTPSVLPLASAVASDQAVVTPVAVRTERIFVATAVDFDEEEQQEKQRTKSSAWGTWWKYCVAAIVLLLITGIIIGVVAFQRNNKSEQSERQEEAPKSDHEVVAFRRNSILEIVSPLSGAEAFDPAGPGASADRIAALEWLVETDPARIPVPGANETDRVYDLRQRYVLALLYFALTGDGWNDRFNFLSGSDACDWNTIRRQEEEGVFRESDTDVRGVVCNADGKVSIIKSYWNRMSGTIPHELSFFSDSLEELNLGGGSISGSIPTSFSQLLKLDSLWLNDNCLTGSLPDTTRLLSLYVVNNNDRLVGSLNQYCNATSGSRKDGVGATLADCDADPAAPGGGSIECDCCFCCDPGTYTCTDLVAGASWPSYFLNDFSPGGGLEILAKPCVTEAQTDFFRSECPCVVNVSTDLVQEPFQGQCTKNCTEPGAVPSVDLDRFR